jgi:DNA-binding NtrC family response regulator
MKPKSEGVRVLVVDDDDTFRQVMSAELSRRRYTVTSAATGQEALDQAKTGEIDVVLLDMRLPHMDGIEVLKRFREQGVAAGVIVLTGHGTIDTAIQAVRLGAYDYLEKPCPIDKVEMTIHKTFEHLQLMERKNVLEDGYTPPAVEMEYIGAGPAFEKLRRIISKVAPIDSTTLILGETGVGKGMVARLLHAQSPRSDKPFVTVNCAALHENLLQSELFGHEKGAFTGATRQRHGLFEVAGGGNLFLDEVGDMSPDSQAKLLRVLDTGHFRRLGSTREVSVDVRVISATNKDLKDAVSRGHFREDLYYRLSTLTIEIPPLRERTEDLRMLIEHFTRGFNERFSLSKHVGSKAMEALLQYSWPGNVRELIHILEQVIVLTDRDKIAPEDLPASVRPSVAESVPGEHAGQTLSLREMQRRHVLSVVEKVGGNRTVAARILEISERNLYRLLKKYDWSPDMSSAESDNISDP